jgi:hypothetical protein
MPRWDNTSQAHSRVSNIKKIVEGGFLRISHEKYIKDGKVLAQLGFNLKVLLGFLFDVSS